VPRVTQQTACLIEFYFGHLCLFTLAVFRDISCLMEHSRVDREPCPFRIVEDAGGAFVFGALEIDCFVLLPIFRIIGAHFNRTCWWICLSFFRWCKKCTERSNDAASLFSGASQSTYVGRCDVLFVDILP
jgi:hypothetical protein